MFNKLTTGGTLEIHCFLAAGMPLQAFRLEGYTTERVKALSDMDLLFDDIEPGSFIRCRLVVRAGLPPDNLPPNAVPDLVATQGDTNCFVL